MKKKKALPCRQTFESFHWAHKREDKHRMRGHVAGGRSSEQSGHHCQEVARSAPEQEAGVPSRRGYKLPRWPWLLQASFTCGVKVKERRLPHFLTLKLPIAQNGGPWTCWELQKKTPQWGCDREGASQRAKGLIFSNSLPSQTAKASLK